MVSTLEVQISGPKGLVPHSIHQGIRLVSGSSSCLLCNSVGIREKWASWKYPITYHFPFSLWLGIVPVGMDFPSRGWAPLDTIFNTWLLPAWGCPWTVEGTPGISPHIIPSSIRHFLCTLQGNLLSSAGGQEQSHNFWHCDSASGFPCFLPGWYSASNSNLNRTPIHLATLCFSFFRISSHFRALWSQCILKHYPNK